MTAEKIADAMLAAIDEPEGKNDAFRVFDHLDDSGLPLTALRDRLKLIEAYDRAGFTAIISPSTTTPAGLRAVAGVFLSAVVQRTRQLRFGPMVYLLPLYHPLRLIDEICMLDQMSGGRFLYGVGAAFLQSKSAFTASILPRVRHSSVRRSRSSDSA